MYDVLAEAMARMPEWLRDEEGWNSLKVDYNHPHVDRLWRQFGENRVLLHRIYPCETEQALLHPHPWPSAVNVYPGSSQYETGIGYGDPTGEAPPLAAKFILSAGSYELTDQNAWHYVRPIDRPIFTMMVIGKPFGLPKDERFGALKEHRHLTDLEKDRIFDFFKHQFVYWA